VLRLVQLPMLRPVLRLSVFFAVLGSLQLFDLVMPLTGGGPGDSTQTLVTFLYSHGIARMRVGFGSAIGVCLFVIAVAFALGWQRLGRQDD
jgi:raffinose/stachyose/melibiose transport system permease protein